MPLKASIARIGQCPFAGVLACVGTALMSAVLAAAGLHAALDGRECDAKQ